MPRPRLSPSGRQQRRRATVPGARAACRGPGTAHAVAGAVLARRRWRVWRRASLPGRTAAPAARWYVPDRVPESPLAVAIQRRLCAAPDLVCPLPPRIRIARSRGHGTRCRCPATVAAAAAVAVVATTTITTTAAAMACRRLHRRPRCATIAHTAHPHTRTHRRRRLRRRNRHRRSSRPHAPRRALCRGTADETGKRGAQGSAGAAAGVRG